MIALAPVLITNVSPVASYIAFVGQREVGVTDGARIEQRDVGAERKASALAIADDSVICGICSIESDQAISKSGRNRNAVGDLQRGNGTG